MRRFSRTRFINILYVFFINFIFLSLRIEDTWKSDLENHPYGLDSFTAPNHNSSNSNQVQPNSDILVQNQGNIDKKRRRRRSHAVIQSAQREF